MLHSYTLVGLRTSSSPEEYFGKFLSLPDELIDLKCYKINKMILADACLSGVWAYAVLP